MKRMCAALLMVCGLAMTASGQAVVQREGEGTRRTELNAMELQPFAVENFGKLTDWQNGAALTSDAIAGKPVLVCTWGDWYAPSKRAVSLGTKLAEKYGKDGLIVVLAHHERGWDTAQKPAAPAGATVLIAHDSKGEFRKALKVDQDPDFYVIDRAGQMRFADVQIESVETAVAEVVAEKKDAAASVKDRMATEAAEAERERLKTEALQTALKFTNIPEQDFPAPTPEDYRKVEWPPIPKDPNQPAQQGTPAPKLMVLPDSNWFPNKPETKGRAVIMYFWSPLLPSTYYNLLGDADRYAATFGRDVVVIGVAMDFDQINGYKIPEADRDFSKFVQKVKDIYDSRKISHYLVAENGSGMLRSLTPDNEIPVPYLVLTSSNLEARWWPVKRDDQTYVIGKDFVAALRDVINVDPGVKARRKAEEAYIKSHAK